jgi:hypothetical protein
MVGIDWQVATAVFTGIEAVSTALSAAILLLTLRFARREIQEMRSATFANTYKAAIDILQPEHVRAARRFVFRELAPRPFCDWSEVDKQEAEKVCHTYDTVGMMIRYGVLPKEFVVDNWGDSLRNSWRILAPLVASLRTQRNYAELWDDFEWLASEARSHRGLLC